jgi:hypothetical protein
MNINEEAYYLIIISIIHVEKFQINSKALRNFKLLQVAGD